RKSGKPDLRGPLQSVAVPDRRRIISRYALPAAPHPGHGRNSGDMNYNWNWGIFFQTSPDGGHTYLTTLLIGTGSTLATGLSAWCLALLFGSIVGVIRTTPSPSLVRLGNAYVELFRNIPLLVQMFLWYFVLPEVLPTELGDWLKQLPDASFYTAVVALGFYPSAPPPP